MSSTDSIPKNLYYTKEHEWASLQADGTVRIGITSHTQESLYEIVFVELPNKGVKVKKMEVLGTVESVKAVSEIFSPVSGEVVNVNVDLDKSPELVNKEPYGEGWIVDIKPSNLEVDLNTLVFPAEYARIISRGSH